MRTVITGLGWLLLTSSVHAAEFPAIELRIGEPDSPEGWFLGLKLLALLTILALAPSIVVLATSFTRIVVVFAFLRQALGTQQSPPTQVLIGLALFLTAFVMAPVGRAIDQAAIAPYLDGEITEEEAIERAVSKLKRFMAANTRSEDLAMFLDAGGYSRPKRPEEAPLVALVPAFVISELTTAFQIGFLLYLPFVVIDLVVASVLMSMGMMMLPPVMISLPLKLVVFVLADGWRLLAEGLITSYRIPAL